MKPKYGRSDERLNRQRFEYTLASLLIGWLSVQCVSVPGRIWLISFSHYTASRRSRIF